MRAAVFLFLFVDIVNIAVNFFPCRQQFMIFYRIKDTRRNYFWVTFLLAAASFSIAVVYPDIMGLFGIIGGIFCSMVGWTIPYLLMIRLLSKNPIPDSLKPFNGVLDVSESLLE